MIKVGSRVRALKSYRNDIIKGRYYYITEVDIYDPNEESNDPEEDAELEISYKVNGIDDYFGYYYFEEVPNGPKRNLPEWW